MKVQTALWKNCAASTPSLKSKAVGEISVWRASKMWMLLTHSIVPNQGWRRLQAHPLWVGIYQWGGSGETGLQTEDGSNRPGWKGWGLRSKAPGRGAFLLSPQDCSDLVWGAVISHVKLINPLSQSAFFSSFQPNVFFCSVAHLFSRSGSPLGFNKTSARPGNLEIGRCRSRRRIRVGF